MTIGSTIRRGSFWTLDGIRGRPVRRHYLDIRSRMSNGDNSHEQLERLLAHAARTTKFYSQYRTSDLRAFPVVNKAFVRSRYGDFQSTAFAGGAPYRTSTSGTSGEPFVVLQDRNKRNRAVADTLCFNEMGGWRLGDRFAWVRAWTPAMVKSRWNLFAQNILPVQIFHIDDQVREDFIEKLRHERVVAMLGCCSAVWPMARFIERKGYDGREFGLRVVVSDSEKLLPSMRQRMEAAFACPVVDRYSNNENGMLACTTLGSDLYRLNTPSMHFEFLKLDSDEPEQPGHPARVVITDLYNFAMPLIRYDLGDIAVTVADATGMVIGLQSVEGRIADVIYDTSGQELPSSAVNNIIDGFPEIDRFQLIQEGPRDYRLRVARGGSTYEAKDFEASVRSWLGADARVSVEFPETIRSEASGKFRSVIRAYMPGDDGCR
jgi:phenylacetate-CoA ligase